MIITGDKGDWRSHFSCERREKALARDEQVGFLCVSHEDADAFFGAVAIDGNRFIPVD